MNTSLGSIDLEPCPFCSNGALSDIPDTIEEGEAFFNNKEKIDGQMWTTSHVQCGRCSALGPRGIGHGVHEANKVAADEWNDRTNAQDANNFMTAMKTAGPDQMVMIVPKQAFEK